MCANCKRSLALLKSIAGRGAVVTFAQHTSKVCKCRKRVVRTINGEKVGATVPHGAYMVSVKRVRGGYTYCRNMAQARKAASKYRHAG